jgi:hypothetical protein
MQISFQPIAKKILILLGAIALLVIIFFAARSLRPDSNPKSIASLSPDTQAAVNSATIFYTLDYTEDPNLWVTRICEMTTAAGCRALRSFYAPSIQAMVQKNHIRTYCQVTPIRLVSEGGNTRVWQVRVALTHPWPGLDKPVQDVFVEVENVNNSWLMNRILFQQEAGDFITPSP